MKNILIIHQSAELYGSDNMLRLFLENIDRTKFNPIVVLPKDGPLKSVLENNNITVELIPVLKLYRKIITYKGALTFLRDYKTAKTKLKKLHAMYNFETVYSNTLAVLAGAFFSKRFKVKHVWHVHEIVKHPEIIAAIFPKLLKKYASVIVCNSLATQENILARIPALKSKTKVIYNGVTDVWLSPETKNNSTATLTVTLVGRISRLKGHQWTINALKPLLKSNKVNLLFVGSPVEGQEEYLEQVETLILKNNLQHQIEIIPFTSNLKPIWNRTDIALMPSTEAESFGLVAAEAMLAGKAVIGSNLGGLKEIIVDNETGFLISPNDDKAFLNAVLILMENPNLLRQMGNKGRERILTHFSTSNYVKKLQEVL